MNSGIDKKVSLNTCINILNLNCVFVKEGVAAGALFQF